MAGQHVQKAQTQQVKIDFQYYKTFLRPAYMFHLLSYHELFPPVDLLDLHLCISSLNDINDINVHLDHPTILQLQLIVMLRLIVFLLDLVLMSSVSTLMSDNATTLFNLGLVVLFTLRGTLNVVVAAQLQLSKEGPSKAINALLRPTSAPQGDRCSICFDDFFMPHKISCNHIFCRDCALLMLLKRDTCPLCLRVPFRLRENDEATSFEDLLRRPALGLVHNCPTLDKDLPIFQFCVYCPMLLVLASTHWLGYDDGCNENDSKYCPLYDGGRNQPHHRPASLTPKHGSSAGRICRRCMHFLIHSILRLLRCLGLSGTVCCDHRASDSSLLPLS